MPGPNLSLQVRSWSGLILAEVTHLPSALPSSFTNHLETWLLIVFFNLGGMTKGFKLHFLRKKLLMLLRLCSRSVKLCCSYLPVRKRVARYVCLIVSHGQKTQQSWTQALLNLYDKQQHRRCWDSQALAQAVFCSIHPGLTGRELANSFALAWETEENSKSQTHTHFQNKSKRFDDHVSFMIAQLHRSFKPIFLIYPREGSFFFFIFLCQPADICSVWKVSV